MTSSQLYVHASAINRFLTARVIYKWREITTSQDASSEILFNFNGLCDNFNYTLVFT